ncbi:MAG: histidine phosphatase family protein [Christensenellales bacterium]
MRIYIARHGQVRPNGTIAEDPDLPRAEAMLTPLGHVQADLLGERLRDAGFCGAIYSSPFLRTLSTSQRIAQKTGSSIRVAHQLREIVKESGSLSDYAGLNMSRIMAQFSSVEKGPLPYPWWDDLAETGEDVRRRVLPLLTELLQKGEDCLLIGHGATAWAANDILLELAGKRPGALHGAVGYNCALCEYEIQGESVRTVRLYDTAHMPLDMVSSNMVMALESADGAEKNEAPLKLVKAHMHLHTSFETSASMESHAYQARALGLNALFITDHDVRMGYLKRRVNQLYFDQPALYIAREMEGEVVAEGGWLTQTDRHVGVCRPPSLYKSHPYAMLLSAPAGGGCSAFLDSRGKGHQASLLADLSLNMAFLLPAFNPETQGICLRIPMSQRPGDNRQRQLCYFTGACPPSALEGAYALPFSIGTGRWEELSLSLSKDMRALAPFGEDNCFCTVHIELYNQSTEPFELYHGGFSLERKYIAEKVRLRQQELADKIGPVYGLKIYACTEISNAGSNHRNSFSPQVPVLDYSKWNYDIPLEDALEHVRRHRAVSSLNHMFLPWKNKTLSAVERENAVKQLIETLAENDCEEVQVLEVGFPEGRYGFSLSDHLRVWDALALKGLLLTGIGVSDSHNSEVGWQNGNNFAACIFSKSDSQEDLLKSIESGRLYSADPVVWPWAFSLSVDGACMGKALRTEKGAVHSICVEATAPGPGFTLRISSHEAVIAERTLSPGQSRLKASFIAGKDIEAIRAQIFAPDGRCCLISNPIYLVTDSGMSIADARLFKAPSQPFKKAIRKEDG